MKIVSRACRFLATVVLLKLASKAFSVLNCFRSFHTDELLITKYMYDENKHHEYAKP